MAQELTVEDRAQWRDWLEANHDRVDEIWLVFFKKGVDRPCPAYREALEEALCFGWIDGMKRRLDDRRYAFRFTPRKARSKWSPRNIELAEKLIAEGRMTEAGRAAFDRRAEYDADVIRARQDGEASLPPEIEAALKADARAWENFGNLAPGYRKQYVTWLVSAKKPETRESRIAEAIRLLRENRKPGMK